MTTHLDTTPKGPTPRGQEDCDPGRVLVNREDPTHLALVDSAEAEVMIASGKWYDPSPPEETE